MTRFVVEFTTRHGATILIALDGTTTDAAVGAARRMLHWSVWITETKVARADDPQRIYMQLSGASS